jgi:putative peptidoglycan lipid II flippase
MTRLIQRVQHPAEANSQRPILRAAAVAALAGMVVKLAATAKEVAVAGVFGRSQALEAYLAAALIPALLINLMAESMNQALIPTLVRVREREGAAAAQRLLTSALVGLCLLLVAVCAALAVGARSFFPLLGWNYDAAKLHLAVRLFYALLPVVALGGIASTCAAVLNSCERFAVPALAPVVTPLMILAAALLLGGRWGIWAVVWASVLGALLHAVWMAAAMCAQGYSVRLREIAWTAPAREVVSQYGVLILSSGAASGGLLADQAMAAMLPAGSVSALAYAGRFTSVAMALLGGALSTALTPYFSRMAARGDWEACRRTLRAWVGVAALLSTPAALLLIGFAPALIRLTLEHGVFHAEDTGAVAPVLAMYAIQIPFFVVSRVFYRFLLALRRTDLIFICGVVNLLLDVGLNLLLMRRMGVAGIALATSLWSAGTLLFLGYWTWKLLPRRESGAR